MTRRRRDVAPPPTPCEGPEPGPPYPFEIRRSPLHGKGAFATRPLAPGTRLIEYAGARLTPRQADARDKARQRAGQHHTFLFAIDDDLVIDAGDGGNAARWLNHSCAPNCDVVVDGRRLWIETLHDIEPGEELVYDYAFVLPERHTPARKAQYPCHCGAATCRGTMLIPKKQAR